MCGQVETLEEVEELVVLGGRNRTVGNNNVNEHSSRSHLVLQVHITSTDLATGYVQHGKLNLIDLAGSERIKVRPVRVRPLLLLKVYGVVSPASKKNHTNVGKF